MACGCSGTGSAARPLAFPTMSFQAAAMGYESLAVEWERTIADEPNSPGLNERDETRTRNDFVILQLLTGS